MTIGNEGRNNLTENNKELEVEEVEVPREIDDEIERMTRPYGVSVFVNHLEPGFHRWMKAPDELKFLRSYHRHLFHINVEIAIDGDREIEFFILQERLKELIAFYTERQEDFTLDFDWEEFYDLTGWGEDKNTLVINSCEHFATWLVEQLEREYGEDRTITVTVSEDGENGSTVSNFY